MPHHANLWVDEEHALAYLRARESLPHRVDALEVLCELLPEHVDRVLDLGTGDGVTLGLVLSARSGATGVGLDFGAEMLRLARERFAGDGRVEIDRHDLDETLPATLGAFDVVVSSFAIHHCAPARQRALYGEVFAILRPGGVFVNVEHVASPTDELHREFLVALGLDPADDDPSNQLVAVEQHLTWLNEFGFANSECFWKWRELAVLAGTKPSGAVRGA
ncbi:MAG TPA: class I SAM-dependent methyltransferase [Acidimicrobiia bacterium]|jgi:SAM-dependent methyltransferase|nr:class I SAM-dependent methyltransferase [Acidimicrobiia bacterium]